MPENNIESPTILAIDSSSGSCSVAIWKNGAISAYYEELTGTLQAKRLIGMVEQALSKCYINYSDLSAVACTVGPGSFTGIRIGLASARAIGFASGVPVSGFNALQVMALGISEKQKNGRILSVLNAGKGEAIYQYFYHNMRAASPPALIEQGKSPISESDIKFPRADLLARLAATYPNHAVEPVPFYVRPPDAKLPSAM